VISGRRLAIGTGVAVLSIVLASLRSSATRHEPRAVVASLTSPTGTVVVGAASPPPAVAAPVIDAPQAEPVHPHPITPERERLQDENRFIGALNDAMDLSDGPKLRQILDEYRQGYPEDPGGLQTGYGIVADCLEHPGGASRAAAEGYCATERGSALRRFVARHCLEGP
jgi:hypothetical protein